MFLSQWLFLSFMVQSPSAVFTVWSCFWCAHFVFSKKTFGCNKQTNKQIDLMADWVEFLLFKRADTDNIATQNVGPCLPFMMMTQLSMRSVRVKPAEEELIKLVDGPCVQIEGFSKWNCSVYTSLWTTNFHSCTIKHSQCDCYVTSKPPEVIQLFQFYTNAVVTESTLLPLAPRHIHKLRDKTLGQGEWLLRKPTDQEDGRLIP